MLLIENFTFFDIDIIHHGRIKAEKIGVYKEIFKLISFKTNKKIHANIVFTHSLITSVTSDAWLCIFFSICTAPLLFTTVLYYKRKEKLNLYISEIYFIHDEDHILLIDDFVIFHPGKKSLDQIALMMEVVAVVVAVIAQGC